MRQLLALSTIVALCSIWAKLVQSSTTCRCEPSCPFEPYGRQPKDIRDFGVLAPCARHGHVVCCDRNRYDSQYFAVTKEIPILISVWLSSFGPFHPRGPRFNDIH